MKIAVQKSHDGWHPEPVKLPTVDPDLRHLNGLQRATKSFRYILLRWEHWASPSGDIREWLRHNTRVGVWLFIPAIFVMPIIGFILWQLTGWLTMLMTIFGHLIVLPFMVLLAFIVIRIVVALFKR